MFYSACICKLEFRARIKKHIKMFRNFSKKSGGRYWFRDLGQKNQQSTSAYFIGPVCSIVRFCEMFLFCLFIISLFSCLAVNNCIGNMLDFPEFLHLGRSFLNQSACRTFQTSILKKQAILNMYLDIIKGLDILGTNDSIKCFCLVMINSGMPPTLTWLIKFQDPWNSNNSRKVLVAKLFFAYGYILIGITYKCIFY